MTSDSKEDAPRNTAEAIRRILDSEDTDKLEKALIELARKIDTVSTETKEINHRTRRLRRYGSH
jgi:hypothetical protein